MNPSPDNPTTASIADELIASFSADWNNGRAVTVEQFLAEHSDADFSDDELFELIYIEIVRREEAGETPTAAEYRRRFPMHGERIGRLFEVHDAVRDADLPGFGTAPGFESASSAVPRAFGKYEILEEVGRGGMGVVYRAREAGTDAVVALKVLRSGCFAGDEEVRRFRAEVATASKVRHPGLVPIVESGEYAGTQYLAMEFIEGSDLAQLVQSGPLESHEAARLIMKVAEALHAVHEQGIIHRDLKPHNVLLDAAGQPRLTDFGVARLVEQETRLTSTGQILGTPGFMPPEQVTGKSVNIDVRSDVYALGGVLYYLLTGRAPFAAKDAVGALLNTVVMDLIPPRHWNGRVDPRLERICLVCLEKEPKYRYASAEELADALAGYLAGKKSRPIRHAGGARFLRWIKQHAGLIVAIAAVVILVALLVNLSNRYHETLTRNNARDQRERYNLQLHRAADRCAVDPGGAVQLLTDQRACPTSLRGFAWGFLYGLSLRNRNRPASRDPFAAEAGVALHGNVVPGKSISKQTTPANSNNRRPHRGRVAFSPDGRLLAFAVDETAVHVFETGTQRRVGRLGLTERAVALAWSSSAETLFVVTANDDEAVRVREWRAAESRPAAVAKTYAGTFLGQSPRGAIIARREPNGVLVRHDLESGAQSRNVVESAEQRIAVAALSADATAVAIRETAGTRTTLMWFSAQDPPRTIGHVDNTRILALALSAKSTRLAAGTEDGRAMLWDRETGKIIWARRLQSAAVRGVEFSPDERCLAARVSDGVVLLDPVTGETRCRLRTKGEAVTGLQFAPNGRFVAVAERDGARFWRASFPSE